MAWWSPTPQSTWVDCVKLLGSAEAGTTASLLGSQMEPGKENRERVTEKQQRGRRGEDCG